jgi:hypothetical protein
MSDTFFNKSKQIANDYIQSIVFLDDRAHHKNENSDQSSVHDLSAEKISALFAKHKKICALYDPENESDINDFKEISLKSDVIVLDWFIDLTIDLEENENPEDDADDDDTRGKYTIDVINNILEKNSDEALKLIVIYTGEPDLLGITEKVAELSTDFNIDEENCSLTLKNIKILVRAKSNSEDTEDLRFKHLVHLQDKVLTYEQLPDFILNEYTYLTTGLLSNFALLSLTTIRQNSSKILGLFNKKLDAAYLGHKSVLQYQNDSETLLIELFGNSIIDLLKYKNVDKEMQTNLIEDFIESIADLNLGKFERNSKLLLNLLNSDISDINKRFVGVLPEALNRKEKEKLVLDSTRLFAPEDNDDLINTIDKEFARITHQKNIFLPNETNPILGLGSVLKSTLNETQYYICIQQRCDSVRIPQGGNRKFLFIPLLKIDNGKFNFLTSEGHKLKLDNSSFSLKTIKFGCDNSEGIIKATKEGEGNSYVFKQIYEGEDVEQFEWVLDLKDLHSQRIVDSYSSKLSRVGLDESEWLRRNS